MNTQLLSIIVDVIFALIKGALWIALAVVYGILMATKFTQASLLEIGFSILLMALGTVLGIANIRKIIRLIKEYGQIKANLPPKEPKRPKSRW